MSIQSLTDEMTLDVNGNALLSGKAYNSESFEDFVVNPSSGKKVLIVDTAFKDCKAPNGSAIIMKGTTLENVSFVNFDCGDALNISSEVTLKGVRVIGKKHPKMIWIRPEDKGNIIRSDCSGIYVSLDISEFDGEVSITGIHADKVKVNPTKHVVLKAELLESLNWKELGISGLSYWKLMIKKIIADKSEEGIFSLPPKSGKNYERSMRELEVLRNQGYVK
jgi:hypothetical protein